MAILLLTSPFCAQAKDIEWQWAFLHFWYDCCFSGSGLGSDLDIYVTGVPGETAGKADGRPNWGWQHLLLYSLSLLPAPLSSSCWYVLLCMVISFFQCYLPFFRPFQTWIPFCNSQCICFACDPVIQEGSWHGWLLWVLQGFCLNVTSSARLSLTTLFQITTHPSSPSLSTLSFFFSLSLSYIILFHSNYHHLLYSIINFLVHNL